MPQEYPIGHADMTSTNEPTTVDSLSEPTIATPDQEAYFSRCYWYGELFCKVLLAEPLFRTGPRNASGNQMNSGLMEAMINFPYSDCIETLDALKNIQVPSDTVAGTSAQYSTLLTKVGAVLDQDTGGMRDKVSAIIQSRGTSTCVIPANNKLPPSPPSSDGEWASNEDLQHIALYTMKFNEWRAKRGNNAQVSDKQLSLDPPRWEVTLNVEGSTFVGKAKKKQTAQHLACKDACEALMIPV